MSYKNPRRKFVKNAAGLLVFSGLVPIAHGLDSQTSSRDNQNISNTTLQGIALVAGTNTRGRQVTQAISLLDGSVVQQFSDLYASHAVTPIESSNRLVVHGQKSGRTGTSTTQTIFTGGPSVNTCPGAIRKVPCRRLKMANGLLA